MTNEKNPIHQPREFRHGSGSRIPETGSGLGSFPPERCPTCGSADPRVRGHIHAIGDGYIRCPDPWHTPPEQGCTCGLSPRESAEQVVGSRFYPRNSDPDCPVHGSREET